MHKFIVLTMKKLKFLSLSVAILAIMLMVACNGKEKETPVSPLVGIWDLVNVDSRLNGVPDESADEDDDTPVTYEFKADSTYVHMEDSILDEGRWFLDGDRLHLFSTEEDMCMATQVERLANDSLFVYLHDSIDGDFIEEHHIYLKRKK